MELGKNERLVTETKISIVIEGGVILTSDKKSKLSSLYSSSMLRGGIDLYLTNKRIIAEYNLLLFHPTLVEVPLKNVKDFQELDNIGLLFRFLSPLASDAIKINYWEKREEKQLIIYTRKKEIKKWKKNLEEMIQKKTPTPPPPLSNKPKPIKPGW